MQTSGAGDPTLAMWSKREEPVLPMPPPDMPLVGWRDPFIFEVKGKQGNGREWGMLMGSGLKGQGGAIMIYRSESLYGGMSALYESLAKHPHTVAVTCRHFLRSSAATMGKFSDTWACIFCKIFSLACGLLLGIEAPFAMSRKVLFSLAEHPVFGHGRTHVSHLSERSQSMSNIIL